MNITIEQIIQIGSILSFVWGAFALFAKAGELKTSTCKDIEQLKEDVKELQKNVKEQNQKIQGIKEKNDISINKIENLLIELKTKLEIFIQNGISENRNKKDKNFT